MALDIHFTDAPLGHEIRGVDLAQAVPDDVFAEIEAAYDRYGVVVFRNQQLTPDQQLAFSQRFGPLDRYVLDRYNLPMHPMIFVVSNVLDDQGRPIGLADAGRYWHTDMWVTQRPPRGSTLYAIEVPVENGEPRGDTYFSSMAAAYDALPDDLRAAIDGRQAMYSGGKNVRFRMQNAPVDPATGELSQADQEGMKERLANMPEGLVHPMVKIHPRTGRKSVYYSEGAITNIVGMSAEESEPILERLRQHVLQPQFIYRHRWRVGDLVMWDNISCIHKATGDFDLPLRRLMHRTTLSSASLWPDQAAPEQSQSTSGAMM